MAAGAQGIWNVDWLNSNSQRKYPLHDNATLKDTTNTLTIPNDFIVDLLWPVHADGTVDPSLFHIIGIGVFGSGVTVSIGYNGESIGSISIDANTFTRNQSFFVSGTGAFFDTVGKITIGSLDTIRQFAGSFIFSLIAGQLVPTVVKPDIRGISALYLRNGNETSDPLQNDIILQGGQRMVLNLVPGLPGEPDRIVFDAVDGVNLNTGCGCEENADKPCINSVNGVLPDFNGNFTLQGDECLLLSEIANGLQLVDECADPCCDCRELNVVIDQANMMVNQITSLTNLAGQLGAAIATMQANILASKPTPIG